MEYQQIIVAVLRAQLSPFEYLVLSSVLFDGLSESEAARELSEHLDTTVSRSIVHRTKRSAFARIRSEVAR